MLNIFSEKEISEITQGDAVEGIDPVTVIVLVVVFVCVPSNCGGSE
jgi:hypothetical protein